MDTAFTIRPARTRESAALSALAVRSKGHWGYSEQFLDACREELAVDAGAEDVYVAADGDALLGYYTLADLGAGSFELDALFVDPPHIGKGVGRALLDHALKSLAARGGRRLTIQGDPNASGFYEAAGARLVGARASGSIPGRELPLYRIDVGDGERQPG
ncbi:MAG: GNAT family N-acetyltransferase [Pseudomonadota bacterium]